MIVLLIRNTHVVLNVRSEGFEMFRERTLSYLLILFQTRDFCVCLSRRSSHLRKSFIFHIYKKNFLMKFLWKISCKTDVFY
jgi:hypothetical protein